MPIFSQDICSRFAVRASDTLNYQVFLSVINSLHTYLLTYLLRWLSERAACHSGPLAVHYLRHGWPTAGELVGRYGCTSCCCSSEVLATPRGMSTVAYSHTAGACLRQYSREWRQRRAGSWKLKRQVGWFVRSRSCLHDTWLYCRDHIQESCTRTAAYLPIQTLTDMHTCPNHIVNTPKTSAAKEF